MLFILRELSRTLAKTNVHCQLAGGRGGLSNQKLYSSKSKSTSRNIYSSKSKSNRLNSYWSKSKKVSDKQIKLLK